MSSKHFAPFQWLNPFVLSASLGIIFLSTAQQALAHHPLGGETPTNFFEGFLSGLGHPVIGLDHLAFVVAIGLIAAGQINGAVIPAGFVLAALVGTGIHLLNVDLPAVEIAIALSVVTFGVMLAIPHKPNWIVLACLGAIAGLFHGYAYGEAIIGAGMLPLVAYLLGFSLIQYGIAMLARAVGYLIIHKTPQIMRLCGLAIGAIGIVFMTNLLFG
ncbi:HupE/UreJ family protein [Gloeocapsopsis dulcis]|uniref:Urease accessory protein UreJ n=1 Tax=Gloeocapsopsis dulcis AAB1 = 1H9 TaxID=1433147 RepID=A0A6N8G6N0_9CHRO|nr:HupE/UreJ family protein [Gloeocapsopsis dulcis]MUL39497.1 urease accessory protein UreJ [Gloeocapsopsis dulcis AAB1 = 1H9]WNN87299.1 HupE/UreJ family protein [Gloeocapsopsis dulcis]